MKAPHPWPQKILGIVGLSRHPTHPVCCSLDCYACCTCFLFNGLGACIICRKKHTLQRASFTCNSMCWSSSCAERPRMWRKKVKLASKWLQTAYSMYIKYIVCLPNQLVHGGALVWNQHSAAMFAACVTGSNQDTMSISFIKGTSNTQHLWSLPLVIKTSSQCVCPAQTLPQCPVLECRSGMIYP